MQRYPHVAVVALFAIALASLASNSLAQAAVAALPPSLAPDAVRFLVWLGLGRYAAGIASLVCVVGYVVVHAMPWMPLPPGAPVGFWPRFYAGLYAVLNYIAGNYGKALNASPKA